MAVFGSAHALNEEQDMESALKSNVPALQSDISTPTSGSTARNTNRSDSQPHESSTEAFPGSSTETNNVNRNHGPPFSKDSTKQGSPSGSHVEIRDDRLQPQLDARFGNPTSSSKQHHHHRHFTSPLDGRRNRDLEGPKSTSKHKYHKSRDGRLPLSRTMTQLASSAGASAKGLLPSKSGTEGGGGKGKDRDKHKDSREGGDDRPRRPASTTATMSNNAVGGFSTYTRSRKSSFAQDGDLAGAEKDAAPPSVAGSTHGRIKFGVGRRNRERCSKEDLELLRKARKQGEEYLYSSLTSMGTLAADITRRLDYSYYNLLEKMAALTWTIGSLHELSDSMKALCQEFERETTNVDHEVRRQLNEFKGFEPQIKMVDALEERMQTGRKKAEELGNRLEVVRARIAEWEKKESDWQARTSRNLRILWLSMLIMSAVFIAAIFAHKVQPVAVEQLPGPSLGYDNDNASCVDTARQMNLDSLTLATCPRPHSQHLLDGRHHGASSSHFSTHALTSSEESAPMCTGQGPLTIFDEL